MNLHSIVSGAISTVNPPITGTLYASTGSTINPDGSQTPTFKAYPSIRLQVQALSGSDIRHMDSLNIQGTMRAVYLSGLVEGLNRPAGKGGDILYFKDPSGAFGQAWWLVTQVLEPWSESAGWTKVAITMQDAPPPGLSG